MMTKPAYTPDGDRIPSHDHEWVMVDVTMHPNPDHKRPILGATVLWRCNRRNCNCYRKSEYPFTRPRKNQQPNTFSPTLDAIIGGGLRQVVATELNSPKT